MTVVEASRRTSVAARLEAPAGFERFGGACALSAGGVALLYGIAFVVLRSDLLSALFLLLEGLLASAALVAIYERVRSASPGFAAWGVGLALAGALGASVHGGYDLSNALHPPATPNLDLPHPVDPRGLLTFGAAGLGLLVIADLMRRGSAFPSGLGILGYVLGALLVWIYLARLIVLDPTNPLLLGPVLLAGFVANPAWYAWLGLSLLRGSPAAPEGGGR